MKSLKKAIALIIAAMLVLLCLASCGNNTSGEETTAPVTDNEDEATTAAPDNTVVNIAALKGPTGMGLAYLMEQNSLGSSANKYNFFVETAADSVIALLQSKQADIAALPSNAAATLYNKTNGNIKILAINTLNVLRLLTSEEISSIEDLKGKTVYCAGEGTTVEYFVSKIFSDCGLTVGEDVTIEFTAEHAETVALAKQGKAPIVILPEPFATQLLSTTEGYSEPVRIKDIIAEKNIPIVMGVYAVRTEFANEHPELIKNFIKKDGVDSHKNLIANTEAVSALIEKYDIMKAPIAAAAVPNCTITFVSGNEMTATLDALFAMLLEVNPASIGGKLPDSGIYYLSDNS